MPQFLTRRAMSAMQTFSFLSFFAAFLAPCRHHCRGHACCLLRDACRAQWHPPLPPLLRLSATRHPPTLPVALPPRQPPYPAPILRSLRQTSVAWGPQWRRPVLVLVLHRGSLAAWAMAVSIVSWAATASGASWAQGRAAPASCSTPSILRFWSHSG